MNAIILDNNLWNKSQIPHIHRAYTHILTILHANVNDYITIVLLNVGYGHAKIIAITAHAIMLELPPKHELVHYPQLPIHAIIGHLRPPVMRRILKDFASLAIAHITIIDTDLSEKSYGTSKLWRNEHYKNHLLLGLEQGKCVHLPHLTRLTSLDALLHTIQIDSHNLYLWADLHATTMLYSMYDTYHTTHPHTLYFMIGPERGWSERERALLTKNALYQAVNLGKSTLRAELACTIVASFAHALYTV